MVNNTDHNTRLLEDIREVIGQIRAGVLQMTEVVEQLETDQPVELQVKREILEELERHAAVLAEDM